MIIFLKWNKTCGLLSINCPRNKFAGWVGNPGIPPGNRGTPRLGIGRWILEKKTLVLTYFKQELKCS